MIDQQLPSPVAWAPEDATRILLAADERELATVRLLLATLDDKARGTVFIEVASAADVIDLQAPPKFEVRCLYRDRGQDLRRAVDAWCEEWLTFDGRERVYGWVAGRGPARVLTAD